MIVFECPTCKKKLQAADQHAGKSIRCPQCQGVAKVPTEDVETATAVTEAPIPTPPPAPTAVTTPEVAKSSRTEEDDAPPKARRKRDDDDEGDDDRPRKRKRKGDDDDEDDDDRPRKRRRDREPAKPSGMGLGMIMLIICGIGVCCVGPILVALLVPAVQKVREAAARTQSTNNLKQIGLGFHSFQDANRRLPFNGTMVGNPNVPLSGSWGYQILPFVEQGAMFTQVNRNSGVPAYLCPGRSRPPFEAGGGAWSDYFFNNYINNPDAASQPNAPDAKRGLMGITDGTSNTVFVGHGNINTTQYPFAANVAGSSNIFDGGKLGTMRSGNNGRATPGGVILARDSMLNPNVGNWGGPFPSGALMCMGDGSVRIFPYNTGQFGAFLSPDGGEAVFVP